MARAGMTREAAIRQAAYFIWEREGRPEGQAFDHWVRAAAEVATPAKGAKPRRRGPEPADDYELVVDGRPEANMPALLTQDVPGG